MSKIISHFSYLLRPVSVYMLAGLIVVHVVALFSFNPLYIGSFLSFLYLVTAPGFLILSFFACKKFPPMLGLALSTGLSVLVLMLSGLAINTLLPLLGHHEPLNTINLLLTFDVLMFLLLFVDYYYRCESPFEFHAFSSVDSVLVGVLFLLPIYAGLGSLSLNNGGSNVWTMMALGLVIPLVLFIVIKEKMSASLPPVALYLIALSLMLMNSLRGWHITGHDILLEYHVFSLTNDHHLWSMTFYQDAYNACLSLTIFPTFLIQLIHVVPQYIFKFFIQWVAALGAVVVYYIAKSYTSEKIAFLVGFLYISFPTFMVDMAFLNRQGMAFLFLSSLIFCLFNSSYFSPRVRTTMLFAFGLGMIFSHYSTSYIAVPVLIATYIISITVRWLLRQDYISKILSGRLHLTIIETYRKPALITLPFVAGLAVMLFFWSTVITKTSNNIAKTLRQVAITIQHPFDVAGYSGPAKYGLTQTKQATPEELLNKFKTRGLERKAARPDQSDFYPQALTHGYSIKALSEPLESTSAFGHMIESTFHVKLSHFFAFIKQTYAKFLQVLLIVGLVGLAIGFTFRKKIYNPIPLEFLALSVSGISAMVAQTVLPDNVVEYGLLRLFQQNLIYLSIPIILGLFGIVGFLTRHFKIQVICVASILLFFYATLSGFIPQITGGSRPFLSLNNSGLYFDSYYVPAEEVYAMGWTSTHLDPRLPIQAAHFSDIKMVAYGRIQPRIEMLPETTRRNGYVYLNYYNAKTNNIIEMVNGDVLYFQFPISFLERNKDLIYDNGGSKIYR